MHAEIKTLAEKKLIGKRIEMTLANNKTFELWKSFMPRRKEITNGIGTDLYSVQVFDPYVDFMHFNHDTLHEKCAAVEVTDYDHIPEGMEAITLPTGLYAVFIHKGPASAGDKTFGYIFRTWIPHSAYVIDDRPHFEILGDRYKNDHPDSEEEVWIPIRKKD
jgi:AraC family transcriptional regulator